MIRRSKRDAPRFKERLSQKENTPDAHDYGSRRKDAEEGAREIPAAPAGEEDLTSGGAGQEQERGGRDDRGIHPGHRRQGRVLLHPRVSLFLQRHRAQHPPADRSGPVAYRGRQLWPVPELRLADEREAPDRHSLVPPLRRTPGDRRERTARSVKRRRSG